MVDEVSIGYRFKQLGVEELTSKIRELHNEFRNGEITYKEYRSQIREASGQGRAATQEFSQMKGAIAAANPELLGFTRTMSLFGGVANTVLSVMNAINLAQIAMSGVSSQVASIDAQKAAAYNDWVRTVQAYPPNDPRIVAAWNKYIALVNESNNAHRDLARQSLNTTVTLIASAIAITGSIAQTVIGFQALSQMAKGTALAMITSIGFIALAVAALAIEFYGLLEVFKILDPQFRGFMDNMVNELSTRFGLGPLEAMLVTPWLMAFADIEYNFEKIIQNIELNINSLIDQFNRLPNAITRALGLGNVNIIPNIGVQQVQNPQDIFRGLSQQMLGGGGYDANAFKTFGPSTKANTDATQLNTIVQQANNQYAQNLNQTLGQAKTSIDKLTGSIDTQNQNAADQATQNTLANVKANLEQQIKDAQSGLVRGATASIDANMDPAEKKRQNDMNIQANKVNDPIRAKVSFLQDQISSINAGTFINNMIGGFRTPGVPPASPYSWANQDQLTRSLGETATGGWKTEYPGGPPATYNGIMITPKMMQDEANRAAKTATSLYGGNYFGTKINTVDNSLLPYSPSILGSGSGAAAREYLARGSMGGSTSINVTVQGSLLTENKIADVIRNVVKTDIRRVGF